MNTRSIINPAALLKMLVYSILVGAVYHSTLTWLVTHDWAREDYSSSYFIPFIVAYLIWDKRESLGRIPAAPSWKGLVPLGMGVALFWLGELSGEYFTLYTSFWMVLVGLCWLHLGWRKLKVISFPLLFMFAMFPLPNFLYTKVSMNLKLISSQLGVSIIRLYGMSAFREGNVIDLGFTRLQVVDACSGLRYLIPLIVLGCLLAYFYRGRSWEKGLIVLSTIPMSIVTNGLRIASVGILYQFWGPGVAEGFFHDFSGWFIFMFTLGLLLLEMWLLKRFVPRLATPAGMTHDVHFAMEGKLFPVRALPHFIAAVLFLGATLAFAQGMEFREMIPIKKSFDKFPEQVGHWTGTRQAMDRMFRDALNFSDYVIVDYRNQEGKNVNFYTAYYASQRKGESIHSPDTCLPGSGWEFRESGEAVFPIGDRTMQVRRAFMQKGDVRELTYFWFPQRGRVLTSTYELKLYAFWDALTKQRTDGALVRAITPVYTGERVETAEARLQEFTRQIVPVLNNFLPGKESR